MKWRTELEFRMCNFHWGKYFLQMIVGLDSEATGPEKDRPEVIIESEELMVEIDYIVLLFDDFEGFPIFRSYRWGSSGGRLETWYSVPVSKVERVMQLRHGVVGLLSRLNTTNKRYPTTTKLSPQPQMVQVSEVCARDSLRRSRPVRITFPFQFASCNTHCPPSCKAR